MVKSIILKKNEIKLVLAFIIGFLIFQSVLPYMVADTIDGVLEISTPQDSYNISIGNSVTITWTFNVPSHEYAVYWEIKGNGVDKSGWGLNANCTTPVIPDFDTEWIYNCSGYWAKYHVWKTVTVKSAEEGIDGIYAQNLNPNGAIRWIANGIAINTAGVDQKNPQIVSDGAGGAIITWEDSDIFAQKIHSDGVTQWTANGVVICTASANQVSPQIVSDGAGGAIITWQDNRDGNNDIYVQKINSTGDVQWDANGITICTESGGQVSPQIVIDGVNGSIITWQDNRVGYYDIYAQRINSSGDVQWDANGTAICTASANQISPQIVSDGANGAIITWQDSRDGNNDIYAQRINSNGVIQWDSNGIVISTESGGQESPQILSDDAGGAIITWQDNRDGNNDIYVQRINSTGDVQWDVNGTAICTESGGQVSPQIVSDGVNGSIITWQDNRDGNYDIYAQRINSSGYVQWDANGTAICTASANQISPQIVSDGANGAIITWMDGRDLEYFDIYAKRINSNGAVQWAKTICTAGGDQEYPQIVSDGAEGAIITWDDNRIEVVDGDGNGNDNNNSIPPPPPSPGIGFPPYFAIIVSSICVIIIVLRFHKSLKNKNSKK